MRDDTQAIDSPRLVNDLLRHQLCALLLRLVLANAQHAGHAVSPSISLQRYQHFRQLVEREFAARHRISDYAAQLYCTEKSLTRAIQEVAGMSAKAYLDARISLEAKRLLAHTSLPVAMIAEQIGFNEATNFVKFFRREAACTPGEFRRLHGDSV
ncbi:MAG: helix-turn-helix transcriptional regulator [Burkholderiaceae bacterium]